MFGDPKMAMVAALAYVLNLGILWPTIGQVYGFEPDSLLAPFAALRAMALPHAAVGFIWSAFCSAAP